MIEPALGKDNFRKGVRVSCISMYDAFKKIPHTSRVFKVIRLT